MLSRPHRSCTVSDMKHSNYELLAGQIQLTGTAEDRENAVRNDLRDFAASIAALTSPTQQDKARGVWVRTW